jgi:hypothetical protein
MQCVHKGRIKFKEIADLCPPKHDKENSTRQSAVLLISIAELRRNVTVVS